MHIYWKLTWETYYRGAYAKINKHFILVLHQMLFDSEPTSMFERVISSLPKVANWFTPIDGTFIQVFSAYRSLHKFLLFVTDNV